MQDSKRITVTTSQMKDLEISQTKREETVLVSITKAKSVDRVNEVETLLCIGLKDDHGEPVLAHKEVVINLICTGVIANGDEFINGITVVIESGSSSVDYNPFIEKYLKEVRVDTLSIALTTIKQSESNNIAIDTNHNFVDLAMIDYQQVDFDIKEVTVDEVAGVVEFTIVLSGASLNQESTVDYFLGKATTVGMSSCLVDSGTLTFSPGTTFYTVTLPFSDSDYRQCDSDFEVILTNSVNAQIKEDSERAYDNKNKEVQSDLVFASIG